jgi:hypothetical protein
VSELVRLDICWLLELVLLIFSSHEIPSRRQSLARSDFATHAKYLWVNVQPSRTFVVGEI